MFIWKQNPQIYNPTSILRSQGLEGGVVKPNTEETNSNQNRVSQSLQSVALIIIKITGHEKKTPGLQDPQR